MGETISHWRERLRTVARDPRAQQIVYYVIVPVLLLVSLWLPPISLGVRVFHIDYPLITAKGGVVGQEGSAQLSIPAGALKGTLRLLLRPVSVDDKKAVRAVEAQALRAIPANLELRGPLYRIGLYGSRPREAIFTAPLPAEVANVDALDLYGWTGKVWQWVPTSRTKSGSFESTLTNVPLILAAMEAKPQGLVIGVGAPDVAAVNAAPLDVASELYLAGLSLVDNGSVTGQIALGSAPANLLVLPTLGNRVKGVARVDWVANLIANTPSRTAHVQAIATAVAAGGYKGLNLEYEGMDADLRDEFTAFVTELAAALHRDGRVLAVRVDEPVRKSDGTWDTQGYDWQALAQAADVLRVPALSELAINGGGQALEECLRAAVNQVNRQKIQLIISAECYEQVGDKRRAIVYGDALSLASQAQVAAGNEMVLPGETVSVELPHLTSGLQEDAESGQVWFAFKDNMGVEHKVWLENATSVGRKLALASQFALRGVSVEHLAGTANDAHIWDTVRIARDTSGRGGARPATAAAVQYSVVWRVESKEGQVVEQGVNPADKAVLTWKAVDQPGDYVISVAISEDGGKTTLGQASALEVQIPTPTPTPSPTPTATPTPKPTVKPQPVANVAQAPAAPAPAGGGSFGYGVQAHMIGGDLGRIFDLVGQMHFGWVKQQVEWFRFNPAPGVYDWGALDAIADAASARGIKVLFSVCKAPAWARPGDDDRSVGGPPADPNTYGEFMREMAAHFKGRVQAYEIWNEQNLWYEWGGRGRRLNAASYVRLLQAAYTGIKAVDPSAVVVSGALTPTGYNDGDVAIDDQLYLRQMYDAGLKRWCDAIGAHPSGYNNPPDADWRTWSDPTTSKCKGHPSWFFRSTMEGYRNIMLAYGDGYKRIWPTEFGWASMEGIGGVPAAGYEYAADNTAQEQADFLVRAYQMGKNWGFVGPMFLWNLNFAPQCGPADEKSPFGILDCGWGPRPAFWALASMPK